MKNYNPPMWTPDEISLLRKEYPEHGTEIAELLKNHSRHAIESKAFNLHVKKNRNKPKIWLEEYEKILEEKYPECGPDIEELLPFFTRAQIIDHANKRKLVKIEKSMFTKEQDELIRENYTLYGSKIPGVWPEFTCRQIGARARQLGVYRSKKSRSIFTKEQDDLIIKYYPSCGSDIPGLEGFTSKQIVSRARNLNVKKEKTNGFTEKENAIIKKKYPEHGSNISELLNSHTRAQISRQAKIIGVKKTDRHHIKRGSSIVDPWGKEFKNAEEMCKAHNASYMKYLSNRREGKSIEESLVQKKTNCGKKIPVLDGNGNIVYNTCSEYARELGVGRELVIKYVKQGLTVEEIRNKIKPKGFYYEGKWYDSKKQLCREKGIPYSRLNDRLKRHNLEEAVKMETREITDPWGHKFSSKEQMCAYHNTTSTVYDNCIKNGFTMEEALLYKKRDIARGDDVLARIGGCYCNKAGLYYKVKDIFWEEQNDYRYAVYVVAFEDGKIVYSKEWNKIKNGELAHPDLMVKYTNFFHGFKCNYISSVNNKVFYKAICQTCGMAEALTPQEMIAHEKEHGKCCEQMPIGWKNTQWKDHNGIEYPSFSALCKAYKKERSTVRRRLQRGMSMKEALS